ncbi:hypothetical protein FB451DRAFT_105487 [Mycena latifolia]|nr:hypothetical protein FB451DRAFT_105487 [Mycena latifolia]
MGLDDADLGHAGIRVIQLVEVPPVRCAHCRPRPRLLPLPPPPLMPTQRTPPLPTLPPSVLPTTTLPKTKQQRKGRTASPWTMARKRTRSGHRSARPPRSRCAASSRGARSSPPLPRFRPLWPRFGPPIVLAPPQAALSSHKRSSSSSEAEGSRASKCSRTASPSPSPSIASHSQLRMQDENDDTPRPRPALLLTPPSPTALALARWHASPRSARPRLSPLSHSTSSFSTGAGAGHHRARSWSARSTSETVCPACDRAFWSARAFRVHALHVREDEEETRMAYGAAVAYALEAAAVAAAT